MGSATTQLQREQRLAIIDGPSSGTRGGGSDYTPPVHGTSNVTSTSTGISAGGVRTATAGPCCQEHHAKIRTLSPYSPPMSLGVTPSPEARPFSKNVLAALGHAGGVSCSTQSFPPFHSGPDSLCGSEPHPPK